LIRIQRIGEDASVVFSMDDPGCIISFRDVKTQYQLGGFRSQLEHWRRSAQTNLQLRKSSHGRSISFATHADVTLL
jgi:hypothetical protein